MLGISNDIGIDLGTCSVQAYVRGRGIVLHEPSVVAVYRDSGKVLEVGRAAQRMIGRTPDNIQAVCPVVNGVISDFELTGVMLHYFIRKIVGRSFFGRKPRIAICVPGGITEVERKAVEDAALSAGTREVFIIEDPVAAAIGAGLDITAANGSMVVDLGGGTTDVAVLSLGGFVVTMNIKIGGNHMNSAIITYIRKKYNLLIGEPSAEDLKVNIGTAYPALLDAAMEVRGRNLDTGLPNRILITSDEISEAIKEQLDAILKLIHSALEATPPELVADIAERGIVMTGGGALLHGLDLLISEQMCINAFPAENPSGCAAIGTGMYIEHIAKYNVGDMMAGKEIEY
ncbi:MAG: rod shape-determining protein [Defluviitaleaceae bacterium]|nr:rod shape-determining protein [Defluviitaleaceae bacterium]